MFPDRIFLNVCVCIYIYIYMLVQGGVAYGRKADLKQNHDAYLKQTL